ncbi:STAS domain-containing protein [Candidatus Oscillochloris fontis]|uniref:STAS domain-containing protein n=1 Tax=Candidatus Oscillochloris fontis TaxID=2496868 RepID=UPI00101DE31F|nr:STAS domain-containing protein [Candidatus Oscillochloris fontis]
MDSSQSFVLESRRQLIRFIALMVAGVGALVMMIMLVLIIVIPNNASLIIYPLLLGIGVIGGFITLSLLPRIALAYAMLPLVLSLIAAAVAGGMIFRETVLIAASFLTVIALLVSLGQQRMIALPIGTLTVLIGVALAAMVPQTTLASDPHSLGSALPFVSMAGIGTVIAVSWLIALRLIKISDQAVVLANQRAQEAVHAHAEAEARANELVEQNEAQQRLIELVASLEMPAVSLADGVILMPLIGHIDTRRSQSLTTHLLEVVHTNRVHLVVIDVSGVAILDTGVVQSLMRTINAVKLLGARVLISGIQVSMATTMVQLGMGFEGIEVVRTPQEALVHLV